jgi:hypothetical protein
MLVPSLDLGVVFANADQSEGTSMNGNPQPGAQLGPVTGSLQNWTTCGAYGSMSLNKLRMPLCRTRGFGHTTTFAPYPRDAWVDRRKFVQK